MSGTHRSSRGASARASAGLLLQPVAVAVVLLLLAAAGLVVYLVVANAAVPSWLLLLVIVLLSALWAWALADIALPSRRKRPRSPAYWVPVIGRVLPLSVSSVVLLTAAGQPYGWTHGAAKFALTWSATLLCGLYGCWLAGERQLVARLTARAAGRQRHSA